MEISKESAIKKIASKELKILYLTDISLRR